MARILVSPYPVSIRLEWYRITLRNGCLKGDSMNNSTKDQAQGKFHEVKGKVKEKVGRATNNPNLEAEGQDEKVGGKVQKKVGQVEKVFEK
jgi:uncharacterized protein YjbJ (UPF0337 family)